MIRKDLKRTNSKIDIFIIYIYIRYSDCLSLYPLNVGSLDCVI